MDMYKIGLINDWLDLANEDNIITEVDDMSRILKIAEELGEVVQAYIGLIGQNPRKGRTHTEAQVLDELTDVVITALCAIQHFTNDYVRTNQIVSRKIDAIIERAGIDG